MKASRHNGRSGKHGVYDVKHNDRDFDVEHSEHIDSERTKQNVYWDCYQGYSFAGSSKRGSLILQKLSVPITMSIIQILWMHRMRGMSRQGIRRETERLMMY